MEATRLVTPKARPRIPAKVEPAGFAEHLGLFAVAMGCERALELLDGLAEPSRSRARHQAREAMSWDSATRQAQLAVAFGTRNDADARLRAVMAEAPPALQQEMFRLLPPYWRSLFPGFPLEPSAPAAPLAIALAERLVREATRR